MNKQKKLEPNQPKFKPLKELPEQLMALMVNMWDRELGGLPPDMGRLVVTYFDTIYTNQKLSEDIYIHELCHFIRQGNGQDEELARAYCTRYLKDKDFRYAEELMAYREQYKFIVEKQKLNKPQAFECAKYLASQLASDKNGLHISEHMALSDIIKK